MIVMRRFLRQYLVAFSLAEVLITLGIIGIVAAMTIPTLLFNYQERQTITKLKDTYSILSNAIKTAEEEEGEFSGFGIQTTEDGAKKVAQHLLPYMKLSLDCGTVDSNARCAPKDTYLQLNGKQRIGYYLNSIYYKIVLLNGVHVYLTGPDLIESYRGKHNVLGIYVDVNGNRKPNQWGRDLFLFSYLDEGIGLVPTGHPEEKTYSYKRTCVNKTQEGIGCAYYVLNFNNMDYLK